MPVKEGIPLDVLQAHFHLPLAEVAKKFGHCVTFMKKICRSYGIKRWPHRKLKGLQRKITNLQVPSRPPLSPRLQLAERPP